MALRILASVALIVLTASANTFAAKQPNFVWLISEDNSKHFLKLFDKDGAETPRIAAMAKQGLLFTHAFSNAPVCSVARTTLITGCYGPRIGTQFHRKSVTVPMPPGLRMFPALLRDAGYYTTNNSKKDYNAFEGPGVWDASSGRAHWRNRKAGQPFFHKQSFKVSHESSLHFPATDIKNKPTKTDPSSVAIAPYHPDTPTFRYTYARYHDRIQDVDRQIGVVLDQLKSDKLLDDTFVFYFGDHGGVLPRGKGYAYESGLHVPLVVRVPKNWRHLIDAKPGSRVDGFVSFVDFGPTLLHLAGISVPKQMDGRPFLGKEISLADLNRRDEAFGYADRFDEKYDFIRTLRKGRYKYLRSYQPFNPDALQNNYRYRMQAYVEWRRLYRAGKLNAVQRQFFERRAPEALYDLENDPHETKNLAANPKFKKIVTDLRSRLANRLKHLPDLSFYPENELVKSAFAGPVKFGQSHKTEIAKLIDVADLALQPFSEAQPEIAKSLRSSNPWERYWGAIVCSCFGKEAKPFTATAKKMAAHDPEPIVRVRAAEFLALIGAADPRPVVMDVLTTTKSGIEAALVLNTVVLLRDGKPGYPFKVTHDDLKPVVLKEQLVLRRLEYLNNLPQAKKRRKKRRKPKAQTSATDVGRAADKPNVVIIYGDDVGYGDVGAYGAKLIPTPNLDKLAREGLMFTDGHCSASTCTPSRFSLLTGIHGFRHGVRVLPPNAPMTIKPAMFTLPQLFKKAGYDTAVIGKWHLGLGDGKTAVNWNGDVKPGPLEVGFDYSFLLPSTNDRVPCVYLENHRVVNHSSTDPLYVGKKPADVKSTVYPNGKTNRAAMTYYKSSHGHNNSVINGIGRIGFQWGGKSALWNDETMADEFVSRTKSYLAKRSKTKPFFLYFSSQDIHVPRAPHPRFRGKSKLSYRGDAMVQLDWVAGEILKALKHHGLAENTIVIFSSDNGPVYDDGYEDGTTVLTSTREVDRGHDGSGPFRGGKYQIAEGGTRVPFIVRWPGRIKPGKSNALFNQIDLIASFADLLGISLKDNQAIDSRNNLAALLGRNSAGLPDMIEESNRSLAIRQGPWKFVLNRRKKRNELYNLKTDIEERNNVIGKHAAIAEKMRTMLRQRIDDKRGIRQLSQ